MLSVLLCSSSSLCAHVCKKQEIVVFIFNFAAAGCAKNSCHVSKNLFFRFVIWRKLVNFAVYRYLNNNYSRLAYPCALDLRKARVLRSSKALSSEEMPSLTESFKEKECVFNLFFLERKDPHAIMDCLFFLFLFICLLTARDKQNISQEYNICKWFHLVYVVAISVMTNTATLYSWVKSSLTSNSLKIQYPLFATELL